MTGIYEIVLLLLALGVAIFAAGELLRETRRRRAEREHLDRVAGDGTDEASGTGTGADVRDEGSPPPSRLDARLRGAGLALPAWMFVVAVVLLAAAIGFSIWAALPQLPLAGLLAGLLALMVPFSLVEAVALRRARKFLEKFVDAVDVMCAALDGGEPPPNALATAGQSAEEPARGEVREAHNRLQLGFSVRRSFARMVERYDSEGLRLLTQTMIVKWQAGGDLSPVLRSVNMIARERLRHDRELRTHLAGAQASAVLTAILPYLLLPFFLWKRPEWFRELLGTALGLQLLTIAILLQFVGFLWLRRLMRVKQ
jgi:tight adherence protein B